eukprot:1160682-Pelagomonas_calceolata.AAC.3
MHFDNNRRLKHLPQIGRNEREQEAVQAAAWRAAGLHMHFDDERCVRHLPRIGRNEREQEAGQAAAWHAAGCDYSQHLCFGICTCRKLGYKGHKGLQEVSWGWPTA